MKQQKQAHACKECCADRTVFARIANDEFGPESLFSYSTIKTLSSNIDQQLKKISAMEDLMTKAEKILSTLDLPPKSEPDKERVEPPTSPKVILIELSVLFFVVDKILFKDLRRIC